ncbi:MAG TPA: hypothetical protein DCZ93_07740 [Elusimicrobia bacterium]|nr:hypothetical protein [Elusimicrobiota bacterium]
MSEVPLKHEILLYRCGCSHCDTAEKELKRLADLHGASLDIRQVKKEGVYDGWTTPMVYVNGVKITSYALSPQKWEKALSAPLERKKLRGEIVDLRCYEKNGAKGPAHQKCAELCVMEIKLPMGLLTAEGELYQFAANREGGALYEELKQRIGAQVEIAGEVYQWESKRTLTAREMNRL